MGERFLKHPPKSQIEGVFGGDQPVLISVYASAVQYLWGREKSQFGTNSTGPIWHQFYWTNLAPVLLDQFYWTNSTGPIWHQFY